EVPRQVPDADAVEFSRVDEESLVTEPADLRALQSPGLIEQAPRPRDAFLFIEDRHDLPLDELRQKLAADLERVPGPRRGDDEFLGGRFGQRHRNRGGPAFTAEGSDAD